MAFVAGSNAVSKSPEEKDGPNATSKNGRYIGRKSKKFIEMPP